MHNFWQQKNNPWLAFIIGLSFLFSLGYSFAYRIEPVVDAKAYDSIAQNIVAGNGFRETARGDILFDRSIQRAGPAYEYFLVGIYEVFGHHYGAVWIIQAILHALSAWLIWLIAKNIFFENGETVGLIAAACIGWHPDLIEISAMLMTEALYLFLTILTLYCFVTLYNTKKWQWTVALAISLAVGILARPPLVLFIPIIIIFYFLKKNWSQLVLFLTLLVLCLTPWTVRNYQVYHQFIPTTLIGEYNVWVGNTLEATGGQLSSGYNPFDEYATTHGYTTIHTVAISAFKNFLFEHPGRFVELTAVRTVRYFSLIRPMGFWFYETGWPQLIFVVMSGVGIAFLFIFGLVGLIKMGKAKNTLFKYVLFFAISAPLLLLPTVVQSRYRFQLYPFFALAAGYVLVFFMKNKTWWRDRDLILTSLVLGIISIIDFLLSTAVVLSRLKAFFNI